MEWPQIRYTKRLINDHYYRVFCCIYLSNLSTVVNKSKTMQRNDFFSKVHFTFSLSDTILFNIPIWKQDCRCTCENYFFWGYYTSLFTLTKPYYSVAFIYFLYAYCDFLFSKKITIKGLYTKPLHQNYVTRDLRIKHKNNDD